MSEEESEFWRSYKEQQKRERWEYCKKSINLLLANGIRFQTLSEGEAHYRIGQFDFWATTGRFWNRITGEKGQGVENLIRIIKKK